MKKKCIICDVDGVLLDVSRIYKEIHKRKLKGEEKWEFFHKYANNPEWAVKNKDIFQIVNGFIDKTNAELFLVTARKECLFYSTLIYLSMFTPYLIMRKKNDKRPAVELKEEALKEIQKDYDVVLAIDDELQNCLMYKRNGITTLRVMNNDNK